MLNKKELVPSLLLFRLYSAINFQPLIFDSQTGLAKLSSPFRIFLWKLNFSLLITYASFLNLRLLQVLTLPEQNLNPVHFPLHFIFAMFSAWCVHTASVVFLDSAGSAIKVYNEVVMQLESGKKLRLSFSLTFKFYLPFFVTAVILWTRRLFKPLQFCRFCLHKLHVICPIFYVPECAQAPSFTLRGLFRHNLQELLIIFFPWLLSMWGVVNLGICATDPIRMQSTFALLSKDYQSPGTLLLCFCIEYFLYNVGCAAFSFAVYSHLHFFRNCLIQLLTYVNGSLYAAWVG